MKIQFMMTDEYGSTSILATKTDFKSALHVGEEKTTDDNVNNALTVDEKKKNWESYMPVMCDENGEPAENVFYAGKNNVGEHMVYYVDDDENVEYVKLSEIDCLVRHFVGVLDKEKWYAMDALGKEIQGLNHRDLLGKTVYFVHKVG